MALPVRLRADADGENAVLAQRQPGTLLVAARTSLDVERMTQPAQLALARRSAQPRLEPRDIGDLEGTLVQGLELAAVVGAPDTGGVRHLLGRDVIALAQARGIHAQVARGLVDEPLYQIGRFRAPAPR